MRRLITLIVCLAAISGCSSQRDDPNFIVVATTNSPVDLDPRGGADEASQNVFQPDLSGVRLSPIAGFTFLKDVSRSPAR